MAKKPPPPDESIETLRRYRAKGIPLMPHQKERLRQTSQQLNFIDKAQPVESESRI